MPLSPSRLRGLCGAVVLSLAAGAALAGGMPAPAGPAPAAPREPGIVAVAGTAEALRPVASRRADGEIVLRYPNGCFLLYTDEGALIGEGAACLRVQTEGAAAAIRPYLAARPALPDSSAAAYAGTGKVGPSPVNGQLVRTRSGGYTLRIAGGEGVCTGTLRVEPDATRAQRIPISCNTGVGGTAYVIRDPWGIKVSLMLTNGLGGLVRLI